MIDLIKFFIDPQNTTQVHYEIIRAYFVSELTIEEIAEQFDLNPSYVRKLVSTYKNRILIGENPFFPTKRTGPKKPKTDREIIDKIISLRVSGNSIDDIQSVLSAQDISLSLKGIYNILQNEGLPQRIPRRSRAERQNIGIPAKIKAPKCKRLLLNNTEEFISSKGGGILPFLPLIEELKLIDCVEEAGYPSTKHLSNINYILSFLALKLIGNKRYGDDSIWAMDRGLGLFAGLNVLPKAGSLSSYSYSTDITRQMHQSFIKKVNKNISPYFSTIKDVNLDFTAIPHWGDSSILEKNWKGSKNKAIKSVLALIAQDPDSGLLVYTDARVKRKTQSKEVLTFLDFWKDKSDIKCLIFDCKFTTYANLSKINEAGIKFITLRQRGSEILKRIDMIAKSDWTKITLKNVKRKYRKLRVFEEYVTLSHYEGKVRQIIVTDTGRERPALIITNDFETTLEQIIIKYARRWLVEKSISEMIEFFHLNALSSSLVIKVDFDLTMSLVANNLYRLMASMLQGYEKCQAKTLFKYFFDNSAIIKTDHKKKRIDISLQRKRHLAILIQSTIIKKKLKISHLKNYTIKFSDQNTT